MGEFGSQPLTSWKTESGTLASVSSSLENPTLVLKSEPHIAAAKLLRLHFSASQHATAE